MMKESEEMIIQMVMIHLKKTREEAIEYYRSKLCNNNADEKVTVKDSYNN